jgi:hypothetical protein
MSIINFLFSQGTQDHSSDIEKQINIPLVSKYDESEKEDDEQSSTTGPTVKEYLKYEQSTGKDTDEDASFSEGEQTKSDEQQQQSVNAIQQIEESRPSSLISISETYDDHESTSDKTKSLINELNKSEVQLQSTDLQVKQQEPKSR